MRDRIGKDGRKKEYTRKIKSSTKKRPCRRGHQTSQSSAPDIPPGVEATPLPHPLIILSSIRSSYAIPPPLVLPEEGPIPKLGVNHLNHRLSSFSSERAFDFLDLFFVLLLLGRPGNSAGSSAKVTCLGVLGREGVRLSPGVVGVPGSVLIADEDFFFREDFGREVEELV